MFTFQNGIGGDNDAGRRAHQPALAASRSGGCACGVELRHVHRQPNCRQGTAGCLRRPADLRHRRPTGRWAAGELPHPLPHRQQMAPASGRISPADGRLDDLPDETLPPRVRSIGAALAAGLELAPGARRPSWPSPWPGICRWCASAGARAYHRRYTRFYGTEGKPPPRMAGDALLNYPDWEAQIEAWQNPCWTTPTCRTGTKSALFNELYYLVDGGTLWADGQARPSPESRPAARAGDRPFCLPGRARIPHVQHLRRALFSAPLPWRCCGRSWS